MRVYLNHQEVYEALEEGLSSRIRRTTVQVILNRIEPCFLNGKVDDTSLGKTIMGRRFSCLELPQKHSN
jgi:hypothetical protein